MKHVLEVRGKSIKKIVPQEIRLRQLTASTNASRQLIIVEIYQQKSATGVVKLLECYTFGIFRSFVTIHIAIFCSLSVNYKSFSHFFKFCPFLTSSSWKTSINLMYRLSPCFEVTEFQLFTYCLLKICFFFIQRLHLCSPVNILGIQMQMSPDNIIIIFTINQTWSSDKTIEIKPCTALKCEQIQTDYR